MKTDNPTRKVERMVSRQSRHVVHSVKPRGGPEGDCATAY